MVEFEFDILAIPSILRFKAIPACLQQNTWTGLILSITLHYQLGRKWLCSPIFAADDIFLKLEQEEAVQIRAG